MRQPTVHRWLSLLETSYQLVRVPACSVNRTKRLVKAAKLYWNDAGLAMHLAGDSEPRGAHLENWIVSDLLAWIGGIADRPRLLHWRTTTGLEVALVIEWRGKLVPIEIETSTRARLDDARGLSAFRAEYAARTRAGLLLHAGEETAWIAEGVLAAPWWRVL